MRALRQFEDNGIYHVMVRGNNKQKIFKVWEDFQQYLLYMRRFKSMTPIHIACFALMSNHAHLIIKINQAKDLSHFMHKLQTAYSVYFNYRYGHSGHVFQGRFKSKPVKDDVYLLHLSRYIHLNPVTARLAKNFESYPWSSGYGLAESSFYDFVDFSLIQKIFKDQYGGNLECYKKFVKEGLTPP